MPLRDLNNNASMLEPGDLDLNEPHDLSTDRHPSSARQQQSAVHKDCVKYISERGLDGAKPLYVHRTTDVSGHHPFRQTNLRLLTPEEDTSIYYGALPPRTLGQMLDPAARLSLDAEAITRPAGVSAGHFFDLIEFRSSEMAANLRTIDKAANNSSVAIELEWVAGGCSSRCRRKELGNDGPL
jgi:hypothetical protein